MAVAFYQGITSLQRTLKCTVSIQYRQRANLADPRIKLNARPAS